MDGAQAIRKRNTAYVQIGIAIACLLVAATLAYVDSRPGKTTGLSGSLLTLGVFAVWMFHRAWHNLRPERPDPNLLLLGRGEQIRARNTAVVQIAAAVGCVVVGALLVYVDSLPGEMTGLAGSLLTLGVLAIWMLRRGWLGLRSLNP